MVLSFFNLLLPSAIRMTLYCCSVNTRTGCLVAGYFTLGTRLLAIIYLSIVLALWNKNIKLEEITVRNSNYHLKSSKYYYGGLYLAIICAIVSVILIYGVKKNHKACFCPWITWINFEMLCGIIAVGFIVNLAYQGNTDGVFIAETMFAIALHLTIHIYLMTRVVSYYQTIRRESNLPYFKHDNEFKLPPIPTKKNDLKELTIFPPYETKQSYL